MGYIILKKIFWNLKYFDKVYMKRILYAKGQINYDEGHRLYPFSISNY